MSETKTLRRDARENIVKLEIAAREVFLSRGLDAPLDEIAKTAGVSVGTLYNRFGSREALIDAVVPGIAGARLQALGTHVMAQPTTRDQLDAFVNGMIDLQLSDPALNDAVLRRFPDATALVGICDVSSELGNDLVRRAHEEGILSPSFTQEDMLALLWLAGTASHDSSAPANCRRLLVRALDAAWL